MGPDPSDRCVCNEDTTRDLRVYPPISVPLIWRFTNKASGIGGRMPKA